MRKLRTYFAATLVAQFFLLAFVGCSSGPAIKEQAYAKLKDHRTFEHDFPTVWKGIEGALKGYKITDRDPSEVDVLEMKKLESRSIETDWIYSQSRDKYIEYQVNGFPKKQYLQTRLRYELEAKKVMGGVDVTVKTIEEIERLKTDGSPNGYERSSEPDSSRANEVLERIQASIYSAAP